MGTRIDAINFVLQQLNYAPNSMILSELNESDANESQSPFRTPRQGMRQVKSTTMMPTLSEDPELEHILTLSKRKDEVVAQTERPAAFDPVDYVYWIEWGMPNIYRYDTDVAQWQQVVINNLQSFSSTEATRWRFNWNSRIVYLPDLSFYIVGGTGNELSDVKSDFYQFMTNTGQLFRRRAMLDAREAPALVYRQGCVYVIGGKYCYQSCEFYNIHKDTWSHFCSLINGRHGATAVLMSKEKYIYAVGGFPLETSSTILERFSFQTEVWEQVHVKLPVAAINNGIFAVDDNTLAIIGGRYTTSVYKIEFHEYQSNAMGKERILFTELHGFPSEIETVYPILYFPNMRTCYIIRGTNGQLNPKVQTYRHSRFTDDEPVNPPAEFNRMFQLPTIPKLRDHILQADFEPKYVIDYQ